MSLGACGHYSCTQAHFFWLFQYFVVILQQNLSALVQNGLGAHCHSGSDSWLKHYLQPRRASRQ